MSSARKRRSDPGTASETFVLAIDRLAAGGDGVGRRGPQVVFVPLSAPGDIVEVEVREKRRTWCRACVLQLVHPGPDRVAPPCRAFGECGGCHWQHLAYPAQLDAKRTIVEDALRRIGRFDPPAVASTIPSPLEYGYRHRARLHAAHRGGVTTFGFFRPASHEVVPIRNCPALHPALNAILDALTETGSRRPQTKQPCSGAIIETGWDGTAVRLLLRWGADGSTTITGDTGRHLRDAAATRGIRLLLGDETREPLALGPGQNALVTTGETFTQVNLRQNPALVALALDLAAPVPGEEILDLCCGLGNISLPAAALGARVIGVDLDGQAILQARENARRLGLDATFARDDAAAATRTLTAAGRRFPLVILNPPRTGARDAVAAIPGLSPARIVVVSCDPATLARDAAALAAADYVLEKVQPIDLFPQTAHVETVTLFRRAP